MKTIILSSILISLMIRVNAYSETGNAYISGVNISGTEFSWTVAFERTSDFSSINQLGSSAACFSFNYSALANPVVNVSPGGPLDNVSYDVTTALIAGFCIVNIQFYGGTQTPLPLDTQVDLFSVSMEITDPSKQSALNWDETNTAFFDDQDQNVTASLIGSDNSMLPVELTGFSAQFTGLGVILKWETASESNNSGFEIERAVVKENAKNSWENIGFVNGGGSSQKPAFYSFADKNIVGGSKFLYRLKQVDYNGSYEYSEEVEVEVIPEEFALYQNYPNPFNPATSVRFTMKNKGLVQLDIYSVTGERVAQIVNEVYEAGIHEIKIDGRRMASGVYFYQLDVKDQFNDVKKMILLK